MVRETRRFGKESVKGEEHVRRVSSRLRKQQPQQVEKQPDAKKINRKESTIPKVTKKIKKDEKPKAKNVKATIKKPQDKKVGQDKKAGKKIPKADLPKKTRSKDKEVVEETARDEGKDKGSSLKKQRNYTKQISKTRGKISLIDKRLAAKRNQESRKKRLSSESLQASSESGESQQSSEKPIDEAPPKRELLKRSLKYCKGCSERIPIHQRVCSHCHAVNEMKKAQYSYDVIRKKKSPKSFRVLLELNDFNKYPPQNQKNYGSGEASFWAVNSASFATNLSSDQIRVSSQGKPHEQKLVRAQNYKTLGVSKQIKVMTTRYPVKCIRFYRNILIFSEELQSVCEDIPKPQNTTIRAFKLEAYHKIGAKYSGVTHINFIVDPESRANISYRLEVEKSVLQMQVLHGFLSMLCGDGSVLIYQLPKDLPRQNDTKALQLFHNSHIIESTEMFTVIQWALGTETPTLYIGDMQGSILTYQAVLDRTANGTEFYKKWRLLDVKVFAHHKYVTAIKSAPCSNSECGLFASGSYDGNVKIWSSTEIDPLYDEDIINKKINNFLWDSGSKILAVFKDDNCDSVCLINLFFMDKVESEDCLSHAPEIRNLRELKYFSLGTNDPVHPEYTVLCNQGTGQLSICKTEELREASSKRKKKSHNEASDPAHSLCIFRNKTTNNVEIVYGVPVRGNESTKRNASGFRLSMSDLCYNGEKQMVACSSYDNFLVIASIN